MQKGNAAIEGIRNEVSTRSDTKAESLKNVLRSAKKIGIGIAASLLFLLPTQALTGRDYSNTADVRAVSMQDGQRHIYDGTWSGYFALPQEVFGSQPNVTGVIGTWVVPQTNAGCEPQGGSGAENRYGFVQWIGIGGVGIRGHDSGAIPLIQAGIQSDVVDGKTTYFVGYELLPQYAERIPFAVRAGDIIYAEIRLVDDEKNRWRISFYNVTQNEHFSKTVTYKAKRNSADWMIERPTNTLYGTLRLPDFDKAQFISDGLFLGNYATINGTSGPISMFRDVAIDMSRNVSSKSPTETSALEGNGSSFTINNETRCTSR